MKANSQTLLRLYIMQEMESKKKVHMDSVEFIGTLVMAMVYTNTYI